MPLCPTLNTVRTRRLFYRHTTRPTDFGQVAKNWINLLNDTNHFGLSAGDSRALQLWEWNSCIFSRGSRSSSAVSSIEKRENPEIEKKEGGNDLLN